jgi:hypothetical protein
MEFSSQFRFDGIATPAWTCDNPGCSIQYALVRHQPAAQSTSNATAQTRVQASLDIRARSLRLAMMKSRARIERTERIIRKRQA